VSAVRRVANAVRDVFATDITRRIGDILEGTGLRVVTNEGSVFGGVFRVVIATPIS